MPLVRRSGDDHNCEDSRNLFSIKTLQNTPRAQVALLHLPPAQASLLVEGCGHRTKTGKLIMGKRNQSLAGISGIPEAFRLRKAETAEECLNQFNALESCLMGDGRAGSYADES
jgi:hypothetical protein